MNWRRLIGLESKVIAVLPSISSATVELAVSRASNMQKNEMVVRPVSLYIFMSSPNVKYGTKIVTIKSAPAKNAITKNAGCRIASLAVASAMVIDFMVVVRDSEMKAKEGNTDTRSNALVVTPRPPDRGAAKNAINEQSKSRT